MDTTPAQTEIGWGQILSFLAIAAVFVILSVRATTHLLRLRRSALRPVWLTVWLLAVWLVPALGALLALAYAGPSIPTGLGKAEPSAAPNGGPASQLGNSAVTEGPPSVS
jgi:hypothetical protein